MTDENIPDDVMELAGKALGSPDFTRRTVQVRIARAILAEREAERVRATEVERERCAKVAAAFIHNRLYKAHFPACSYHSSEIADAIRYPAALPHEVAMQALADQAQELDMGYEPDLTPTL